MGYFVYFDCKMEGLYDNRDMKRRIFSSFIEVISFLGTLISGMKMRVSDYSAIMDCISIWKAGLIPV